MFGNSSDAHQNNPNPNFTLSITMKLPLYFAIATLAVGCSNAQDNNIKVATESNDPLQVDSIVEDQDQNNLNHCELNLIPGEDYNTEKREISELRSMIHQEYQSVNSSEKNKFLDSISYVFTSELLNKIVPYWYGTEWDFSGYTAIPNQGEIACGYFVSTTLKHAGINLNRYRMAQQSAKSEGETLAMDDHDLISFTAENLSSELDQLDDGLYLTGLSNHVGYLYLKDDHSFFIHSDYVSDQVVIENALESEAFHSNVYYLAKITNNRSLMRKWLSGDVVEVVMD